MSTSSTESSWIELQHEDQTNLPSIFSSPIRINCNEFILITRKDGIIKYNICDNEWNLDWIKYPQDLKKVYNPNIACFDFINKFIYIYDSYGKILKVNIKTKSTQIIQIPLKIRFARFIFTNCNNLQQLHLIGGADSNKHYISNIDKVDFIENYIFDQYENGVAGFGIIYLNKNNHKINQKLIKIGGIAWDEGHFSDDIYQYNLNLSSKKSNNNDWSIINKELKILNGGMSRFGFTMTKSQKYIFLLGGFCDFESIDNIHFIDTKTWKIKQSEIKCPKISKDFVAITIINELKDELIAFGYCRDLWYNKMKKEFEQIQFPPFYIIKFINNWYYNEWIYLIEYVSDPTNHWKIHTDDIINNPS